MALNDVAVGYAGTTPGASLIAPTTAETIVAPTDATYLLVVIGATATTVTLLGKGTTRYGVANPNLVLSGLTSTTRLIKIDKQYRDPVDGNADITFSQVASVTACVVRFA